MKTENTTNTPSLSKKEQERAEIYRAIWAAATDLVHAGGVDAWDFKQYVLGTMFYRYISENLTAYLNAREHDAGIKDFDYAKLSDKDAKAAQKTIVDEKGFFILPSQLFCNVLKKAPNDKNLNETLEGVFRGIEDSTRGADSEEDFQGLFADFDVNSSRLGTSVAKRNEKLVKLLVAVGNMKLGENYKNNSVDAFGDAYEYLMGMYASNAGKKGGEFFTPQEVSELLIKIATLGKEKRGVNKIYDPACGSGSLLLKAAKILGKKKVRGGFFGQEINRTTYNLCRINMFLHDIEYNQFDIKCEDTLTNPAHDEDERFEVIVSNPPYSTTWVGDGDATLINDPRFSPAGVLAPKNKADFAFIMHSLYHLDAGGTAAIVCFPGIMYRSGAEQKIRQYLVDNNYVDAVIQLPPNLFFGTSIATCVLVLKKGKTDNKTLFIDASKEFVKATNSNKLTQENISTIVEAYAGRKNKKHFSQLVPNGEIAKKNYTLTISSYVEPEDTSEKIDIKALNKDIASIVAKEEKLRREIDKIVKSLT